MTLEGIEQLLVAHLRSAVGREADVRPGPVGALPLGGLRETIFAHAVRFEDHGGVDADGARIARRRVEKGAVAGIAEERPGRVVVEVWTIATAYARVQALSRLVTPAVLLALASRDAFVLSETADGFVSLRLANLSASLRLAETRRSGEGDVAYHVGRQVFHLEGALHVLLTRPGGLIT